MKAVRQAVPPLIWRAVPAPKLGLVVITVLGHQSLLARKHRPRYSGWSQSFGAGPEGAVPVSHRPDETVTNRGETTIYEFRFPATL
jgi:hypothetical protein